MMTKTFAENDAGRLLQMASELFAEKNAQYGDNYLRVGAAMSALFPGGLTLKTEDDWNRLHIFLLMIVKLTRYSVNWKTGHPPSIEDNTVYSAMLDMIDRNIDQEKEVPF